MFWCFFWTCEFFLQVAISKLNIYISMIFFGALGEVASFTIRQVSLGQSSLEVGLRFFLDGNGGRRSEQPSTYPLTSIGHLAWEFLFFLFLKISSFKFIVVYFSRIYPPKGTITYPQTQWLVWEPMMFWRNPVVKSGICKPEPFRTEGFF